MIQPYPFMNEPNPLVSVIIPNYNHARFLKQRIDSVVGQTYSNFEVILLDDCSTDDSRDIINGYAANPHVSHIVLNDKNSGSTFVQWQKGFDLARGEYIWIAESDDIADCAFLEKMMGKMKATPHAVLGFCGSTFIDQEGQTLPYSWDETKRYENQGVYDGKAFAIHRLVYKNILYNASMMVFRKACLQGVHPIYRTFRYCGDWSFWFDICLQGVVVQLKDKLNHFRQHTNKVSTRSRHNGDDFKEGARCQLRIIEKLGLSPYQRRCIRGRVTKRIRKADIPNRAELIHDYPQLYAGTWRDILTYELDKILGWSGLK